MTSDRDFIALALTEARLAGERGEVPVGAVLVLDNQVIARGGNRMIGDCDPSAHAEIVVLRAAGVARRNYRLPATTLYVTVEPCAMCAGALVHARVARLVYGASEPRAGVATSQARWFESPYLNHRVTVEGGVLKAEAAELMQSFFRARRVEGDAC